MGFGAGPQEGESGSEFPLVDRQDHPEVSNLKKAELASQAWS